MCEKETYRCKLDDRKAKQRPVPLFPTLFLNLKIYSPGKGNALIMLCRDELELWWIGGKHAQGEREPSGGTERGVPSELAGKGKDWNAAAAVGAKVSASGEAKATKGSEADVSTYYATYAYGPVTVAFAETEYDSEATTTTADVDFTGYSVAYTVTDEISIAYKVADQSTPNASGDVDQEVNGVTASYTAGGMTISGKMVNGDNMSYSSAVTADKSMWEVAASFAF